MFFAGVENDNNSVVITDDTGIIQYINKKFLQITGYTKEEVIGKHTRILKSGETDDSVYTELWNTITKGKIWNGEFLNKKKNGVFYWERATIIPLYNGEPHKIIGYIGIKSDITDRKLYEETLEKSNLAKSKLFSIISHDLKNPFSALLGYTELLYSEIDTLNKEEIKKFSYDMFLISKQVNTLLINLLDWSRLQLNNIKPNYIKINLFDFINYIFDTMKLLSDVKNIQLINDVEKYINIYVDEKMMYSILYNLIYNSIKFTNNGGNVIISIVKNYFINNDRVAISVMDNGIGMTYENMSKLFVIDGQYTTIGTNNEKGSGLGLSIVKEFLEKMGGKMEIKSEKGKGTEFIFDVELYNF